MSEDDSNSESKDMLLLALGIVLLSIFVIANSVVYTLLATEYDVRFPLWVAVVTPVVAVVVLHAVIGVPVARSRFGHLPFRELLVKQLLGGLIFLPPFVIIAETAIIYIGLAMMRMDPFPKLFPSWGIVILWFHALICIFLGVPCAVGLYWIYIRVQPYSSRRNAT